MLGNLLLYHTVESWLSTVILQLNVNNDFQHPAPLEMNECENGCKAELFALSRDSFGGNLTSFWRY